MNMLMSEYNYTKLIECQEVKLGKLYFFKTYIVAEFNEGVHIDSNNFKECVSLINNFYKENSFGFIANRTHSYSLDLNDAKQFNNSFPKLKAYAVVSNTLFGKGVFEIENQFFSYNREIFKNIEDAILWVQNTLKTKN